MKKSPHKIGKNHSIRKKIANIAMIPPNIKLPESPMNIFAGKALNHKHVRHEKNNEHVKTIVSEIPLINRELEKKAKNSFPYKTEKNINTKNARREFFNARPSTPSAKLTALEVPAMMNDNMKA